MNEERMIRMLADKARRETPPQVDVAGRVMAILASRAAETGDDSRALAWVAGFSAAAAVPVAVAALGVLGGWTDPLLDILYALTWGAP